MIDPVPHEKVVQFVTILCLRELVTKPVAESLIEEARKFPPEFDDALIRALAEHFELEPTHQDGPGATLQDRGTTDALQSKGGDAAGVI